MIQLEAPDILRTWRGQKRKLLIPGGWPMRIPEVEPTGIYREAYRDFFINKRKLGIVRGEAKAKQAVQDLFTYGFKYALLGAIFWWAKEYCKLYPERVLPVKGKRATFEPVGFNAAEMQRFFIPGEHPGRGGRKEARLALMEMK